MSNDKLTIEPVVGQKYVVKHSSGIIRAEFLYKTIHQWSNYGGINRRSMPRYHFLNLATNKNIVLKSRGKILRAVEDSI